jgi:hypothetical protein
MDNFPIDLKRITIFMISAILRPANIHILVFWVLSLLVWKIWAENDDYDHRPTTSDFSWPGLPGRK